MSTVDIRTKDQLIELLSVAAELEHNLACQYLYASWSLKRAADDTLSAAQLETVRGWGARINFIARQEMEHLGLVMNLRTAISAPGYLQRPDFPLPEGRYGSIVCPTNLAPFNQETLDSFILVEAPDGVGPDWCPGCDLAAPAPSPRSPHPQPRWPFESIEDLYKSLGDGFVNVACSIGEKALFDGAGRTQIYGGIYDPGDMNDLTQYGMAYIEVKNLETALEAIDMITEQGEGVRVEHSAALPPEREYRPHTHYCIFNSIKQEFLYLRSAGVEVAVPLMTNPTLAKLGAGEAGQIAGVWNRIYHLMLSMLTQLYAPQTRQYSKAQWEIINTTFFPLMTMFIRPLGEILTALPVDDQRAGPTFQMPVAAPTAQDEASFFSSTLLQMKDIRRELVQVTARYATSIERLRYINENWGRLCQDWETRWQDIGRKMDSV